MRSGAGRWRPSASSRDERPRSGAIWQERLSARVAPGSGTASGPANVATGLPAPRPPARPARPQRPLRPLARAAARGRRGGGRRGRPSARARRSPTRSAPTTRRPRLRVHAGGRGARAGRARGLRAAAARQQRRPDRGAGGRPPLRSRGALPRELRRAAGLTLHVRLIDGEDSQHVLEAIFKALGVALAQATRRA